MHGGLSHPGRRRAPPVVAVRRETGQCHWRGAVLDRWQQPSIMHAHSFPAQRPTSHRRTAQTFGRLLHEVTIGVLRKTTTSRSLATRRAPEELRVDPRRQTMPAPRGIIPMGAHPWGCCRSAPWQCMLRCDAAMDHERRMGDERSRGDGRSHQSQPFSPLSHPDRRCAGVAGGARTQRGCRTHRCGSRRHSLVMPLRLTIEPARGRGRRCEGAFRHCRRRGQMVRETRYAMPLIMHDALLCSAGCRSTRGSAHVHSSLEYPYPRRAARLSGRRRDRPYERCDHGYRHPQCVPGSCGIQEHAANRH